MSRDNLGYYVERISSERALAELETPWKSLLAALPRASIFVTWEWIDAWWRNREQDWELWLLAVWDENGQVVGIAPWMLVPDRTGPVALRRLAFAGNSHMARNHMDVLIRPGHEQGACAALAGYLKGERRAWDVLDLEALAEGSPLRTCLGAFGGFHVEREALVAPYIALPDDWRTYERETLSANRRQQARSRQRRLERDFPGQVEFHRVTEAGEVGPALDTLIELSQERWHGKGLRASVDDDCFVAFQRSFAPVALEHDWLRFYQLRVAGRVIATEYCFRYGEVFTNYQRGFDLEWQAYSPGQLLYSHVIEQAIAEGAREFDMLRGAHPYKLSWANKQRYDLHPVLSTSWQGHLWLTSGLAFDGAQAVGRKVVPPGVRERINQYLGSRRG